MDMFGRPDENSDRHRTPKPVSRIRGVHHEHSIRVVLYMNNRRAKVNEVSYERRGYAWLRPIH